MSTYKDMADYIKHSLGLGHYREDSLDIKRLEMEDLYSRVVYTDKKEIISKLLQGEKFFHKIKYGHTSGWSTTEVGFSDGEFRLSTNGIQFNKFDINNLAEVFTSDFYSLLEKEEYNKVKWDLKL